MLVINYNMCRIYLYT